MSDILIIGSKPYNSFNLNDIIDSFENNCRSNFGMPNNNFGTKYDKLGLCNHLHERHITKKLNKKEFVNYYKQEIKESYLNSYYDLYEKNKERYSQIFYANPRTEYYNLLLQKMNSPYRFKHRPRTGYAVLFENLILGNKVFVTNFSIFNEQRVSHYVNEKYYESACHSAADETQILRWLHEHEQVDATLCFLEDTPKATLNCDGLQPTDLVVNRLIDVCGGCVVNRTKNEKKD